MRKKQVGVTQHNVQVSHLTQINADVIRNIPASAYSITQVAYFLGYIPCRSDSGIYGLLVHFNNWSRINWTQYTGLLRINGVVLGSNIFEHESLQPRTNVIAVHRDPEVDIGHIYGTSIAHLF